MNLNRVHGQSQQSGTNTNTISGEGSQVNALLSIIEVQQAQSNGLSSELQKTIEELIGRVKDLTDNQNFLENELLAEKKKSAELKKKQDDQEKARVQQEQARLEAARKENEEKRKQLEAEKSKKRDQIKKDLWVADVNIERLKWILNYEHVPIVMLNDGNKYSWLQNFYSPSDSYGLADRRYRLNLHDPSTRSFLSQELTKWESLRISLWIS